MKISDKLKIKIDNFLLFFVCFGLPLIFLFILGLKGYLSYDPNQVMYRVELKETNQVWKKVGGWQNE